jgi:hypothetical protein
MTEKFTSHLKVDKKIVELLSKQTYQKSFSAAIRELVSNSYDADALSVNISYDKGFSYIEIIDDGNGMTKTEFEKYLTIAGTKQDSPLSRKYKRKKIGQFGVGFLSIFPFCESLEITTTAENSTEVLKAVIPTKDYFQNNLKSAVKKEGETLVDDIPIAGTINTNPSEKLEHYTKIRLLKPTHIVKQYFTKPQTKKRDSIIAYDPADRFRWELQEDLPIALPSSSKYYKTYKYQEPIGMNVTLNKVDLTRNDYLESVLDEGEVTISGIKCKYIFTTSNKSVKPSEARGIKLRVNNVGIGQRTEFYLKRDRGFSRLHWITGEIFFSEQIKEHLNIGRDGFISHPVTDEIFELFADKLRIAANDVETIDVAEKEITKVTSSNKTQANIPKSEVIAANIKKLESKGFKVLETDKSKSAGKTIKIDRREKTIYIPKEIHEEKELITILDKQYEITYDRWDVKSKMPACKRVSSKVIAINQNYPLFQSRSAGNIFKRIHLMILIASENTKTSQQLSDTLNKKIVQEFKDYI